MVALLAIAATWGVAFTPMKLAVEETTVSMFLLLRLLSALLFLMPLAVWSTRRKASGGALTWPRFDLSISGLGLLAGLLLAAVFFLQLAGLALTVPSNAGFITGTTVVFVPLLYCALVRKIPGAPAVAAVVLALFGVYFASGLGVKSLAAEEVNRGDVLLLLAAVFNAAHIVLMGVAAQRNLSIGFNAVQVFVMTVLVAGYAVLAGEIDLSVGPYVVATAFVTGFYAIGMLLVVQVWAQRLVSSVVAALIFTCEPVFAALTGYLWINERFSDLQVVGFGLILAAMIVAEMRRMWVPAERRPIIGVIARDRKGTERTMRESGATKGAAVRETEITPRQSVVSEGGDR